MKKTLSLILAFVMCLSLCACGANGNAPETTAPETTAPETAAPETAAPETAAPEEVKMSKDEMLAIAEEYTATNLQNDSIENIVRAKQKYCNKTILFSGTITNIQEDHIEVSAISGSNYMMDVYLSIDELVELEDGQYITVVGTTTDEIKDSSQSVGGTTFRFKHYQMPVAYFVKDTLELTGILKGVNSSYNPAFNIQIGESNVLKLIYFAESVDTSTLKFGQKITFVAKVKSTGSSTRYYDAEIIG